jgi:predicted nuclease of predicted toxin-antitoxin system
MSWAKDNGFIVFTHDLDFGAILASTNADGPSVIQVRTQDVSPQHLSAIVLKTLKQYSQQLERGALIAVDEIKSRVRILPVNQ